VKTLKTTWKAMGLALVLAGFSTAALSTAASAQDACQARCQALESQCLQQTKGDRAKCNAVATQCFQSCRKPR
jgi:hypothetical protein